MTAPPGSSNVGGRPSSPRREVRPLGEFPPTLESYPAIRARRQKYIGPTTESNWVIPGVMMAGAFPATVDDDETNGILWSILELGITTFVCLQQEYQHTGVTEAMWRSGRALR